MSKYRCAVLINANVQVHGVAHAVQEQMAKQRWTAEQQPALQQLISSLALHDAPQARQVAAAAVSGTSKVEWRQEAWQTKLIGQLRHDSNLNVAREAFSSFCY